MFKQNCNKNGIKTRTIKLLVTSKVYDELNNMSEENDMTIQDFLRTLIDYHILNKPE